MLKPRPGDDGLGRSRKQLAISFVGQYEAVVPIEQGEADRYDFYGVSEAPLRRRRCLCQLSVPTHEEQENEAQDQELRDDRI